jgi:hypothetical protein
MRLSSFAMLVVQTSGHANPLRCCLLFRIAQVVEPVNQPCIAAPCVPCIRKRFD